MGCFDSVMIPCPSCGTLNEFQSKSGACLLKAYHWPNVPISVLMDVNRHAPIECEGCVTLYAVWMGGKDSDPKLCIIPKDTEDWNEIDE